MFKVGDKVSRTGTSYLHVEEGEVYTVRSVGLHEIKLSEVPGGYSIRNFRRAPGASSETGAESDPSGISLNTPGAKADAGKLRPALVFSGFADALEAVALVGTKGATKYTPNGWLSVPNGFERYSDAQTRHELKRHKGETHDSDSGDLHLAHEAWNALAKLQLYINSKKA